VLLEIDAREDGVDAWKLDTDSHLFKELDDP
jgi:hypothetical protein